MSVISMPFEFDAASGVCKGYQIIDMASGIAEPVGIMRGGEHLPIDLEKLSQNFAAMLNGHGPLHSFDSDYKMYFERHSEGINFRFRNAAKGGVSEVGALFTLMPGVKMEIGNARI